MKQPVNSWDLRLQAIALRVLPFDANNIILSTPTLQFKYGSDNIAQPQQTVVTATLAGVLEGTVTFVTTGLDPVPQATGNSITINPEHMTGDIVTVSASISYLGVTYQAVPVSISKIYNQLVAKTTRGVDLLPTYADGTGYTLPAADNFLELYNGVVPLTTGVAYGPATQTKNGLTVAVNATTGLITVSQSADNAWTSNTESFTLTAQKGSVSYNTTYTITKAKQGLGGQQRAEVALYQWATAEPSYPLGTSQYNWITQVHTYSAAPIANNTDLWTTSVPVNPNLVGIKLWKITKIVGSEAALTVTAASFTWSTGTTTRSISTEANELIKTARVKVYRNEISIPTPPAGISVYTWSSAAITAVSATPQNPTPTAAPANWSLEPPATQPGFTLYEAAVDLVAAQSEAASTIDWSRSSITAVRYSGTNGFVGADGLGAVAVDLTNATHAIPTDSTGAIANFANSGTDVFVYEGATPLEFLTESAYTAAVTAGTAAGKFKVTSASSTVTAGALTAVTVGSVTGARFANLTAASFATTTTGLLNITVTGKRLGGTDFTYLTTQTFTKTPSGQQGVPGVAYWLVTTSSVVQKNINNAYSPTSITVTGKQSSGTTASNFSGYFKIFLNGSATADYQSSTAEAIKAYTIPANTTTITFKLFADSGFSTLLDEETVPVVSDGATGQTGASARRAYVVATTTPAGTPATFTATGDQVPDEGTWFSGKTWLTAAPSTALAAGETLYQSDGVYVTGGNTTWGYPYISALKVGKLSSITIDTGALNISESIKGGSAESLTVGNGFWVDSAGHLRVGDPTGAKLQFDNTGLKITNAAGSDIFTVVSAAQSAATTAAGQATTAAVQATTAVALAGSVTWLGDSSIEIVTGTTLRKTVESGGPSWDAHRYSAESYVGGAYVSFQASNTQSNFMIGLNTDPASNSSYSSIDYAWYCVADGSLYIYESNSGINTNKTYNTDTVLSIVYDNRYVKYYINGVLERTVDTGINSNLRFYIDSSFYNLAAEAKSIRFGPAGPAGVKGDTGAPGTSPIIINCTNENITFTSTNSNTNEFTGINFANGSAVFTVFKGTEQLQYGTAINQWRVTSTNYVGVGYNSIVGPLNNSWVLNSPASLSQNSAYAQITITYRDSSGVETSYTRQVNYSLTRPGTSGSAGARGSLQGYGSKYGIAVPVPVAIPITSAKNTEIVQLNNRVIRNIVTGESLTSGLVATTLNQIGDLVTLPYSDNSNAITRFWDGLTWVDPQVIINGNLIATGTIAADKLAVGTALIGYQIRNATSTFVIDFGANPYISISV